MTGVRDGLRDRFPAALRGHAGRAVDDRAGRAVGAGIVGGLALAMAAVEVEHVRAMSTTLGVWVWAVLPLVTNLTLACAAAAIWRSDATRGEAVRMAAWTVGTAGALAVLAGWTIVHQNVRGHPFAHAVFVTVNNAGVGGVLGALLGWYDVRNRRRERDVARERERADDERRRLEFLNRLLRHNVLNGMNVVLGHGDHLEPHVDPEGREHLRTMLARCDHVVDLIQRVRTVTAGVVGDAPADPGPRDLAAVLREEVASARLSYERAQFDADVPEHLPVVADDMLPAVFENVLSNAVYHNDGDRPHVSVSVTERPDAAVVRVADDGPGVPDDVADSVFDWNARGDDSAGTGIGLAIVQTLVRRYGGRVSIANGDAGGAVVTIVLPKPDRSRCERTGESRGERSTRGASDAEPSGSRDGPPEPT